MAHLLQVTAKHSTIHEVEGLTGQPFFVACTRHGVFIHRANFRIGYQVLKRFGAGRRGSRMIMPVPNGLL